MTSLVWRDCRLSYCCSVTLIMYSCSRASQRLIPGRPKQCDYKDVFMHNLFDCIQFDLRLNIDLVCEHHTGEHTQSDYLSFKLCSSLIGSPIMTTGGPVVVARAHHAYKQTSNKLPWKCVAFLFFSYSSFPLSFHFFPCYVPFCPPTCTRWPSLCTVKLLRKFRYS